MTTTADRILQDALGLSWPKSWGVADADEDDEERRERELREAQRLYAEMGATRHTERLRKQLGVPKA